MDQGAVYHIGGFVGHMYCGGKIATTSFDRCRNRGDIDFAHRMNEGDINCGGFIGHGDWGFLYASTFSFTNCVNSGDITVSVGSDNNWANGRFSAAGGIGRVRMKSISLPKTNSRAFAVFSKSSARRS